MSESFGDKIHASSSATSAEVFHELYRFAFETSRDIALVLHTDGRIADANAAAIEAYGYSKDELLHLTIADLLDRSQVQDLNHPSAELHASGTVSETIHRRKDGSTFAAQVTPQRFETSGQAWFITTVRDSVSAIRPSLTRQAGMETHRQLALEAAGMGTWEMDLNTGRLLWDERCRAIFGVPADQEMTYELFLATVHPEDRERVDRDRMAIGHDQATYGHEYRVVQPDGSIRWVMTRGGLLFDEDG
ncbi:MAG: PAS domain S-box protein [Acidobacteria bacterium]|nr:PAS domain S-box protein [Acidobacteriota bacterium]